MGRPTKSRALTLIAASLLVCAVACSPPRMCAMCKRAECGNLTFTTHLSDGATVASCCARCGLRSLKAENRPVASLSVRDFDTASELDAHAAAYVEGSDVTPCSSMHGNASPPRDERGCCMAPVYDRCMPSLLAFAARDRADLFAREHGGSVRSFAELAASIH